MSTELATVKPIRILSPQEAKQIASSTPKADLGNFDKFLKHNAKFFAALAPEGFGAERFIKTVFAAVVRTPNLQNCTIDSIFKAAAQACELGLTVGSSTGEGYLVPYGGACQFIPGYRGLVALAFRSGHVKSVRSKVVYQGDAFTYKDGLQIVLEHEPDFQGSRDAKYVTHAYCIISLKDGGLLCDVMTRSEIDAIRARSKAGGSGPWVTDFSEMAKKTVTRRCLKYAPMSVEMSKALAADEAADTGDYTALAEFESYDADEGEQKASKSSQVRDKIAAPEAEDGAE